MIGGGFSLFGFDLFGLTRRVPTKVGEETPKRATPEAARNEREADRISDPEYSESFFWGMYPVY